MLNRTFKVRSKIVNDGQLGSLRRVYNLVTIEHEEAVEHSYPVNNELTFTVVYSNDGVIGKTISFTSVDEVNKELESPDLDYEEYSVTIEVKNNESLPNTSKEDKEPEITYPTILEGHYHDK